MRGWLIVNSFVQADKFRELYDLLLKSAKNKGISLEIICASQIMNPIGEEYNKELLPDFVLFWDKDIYLARRLEKAGVRLFNSAYAVETCDNKILTGIALAEKNIKMPKTFVSPKTFEKTGYCNFSFLEEVMKELSYPIIIKEAYGSFGFQVYMAKDEEEAKDIIVGMGYKDFLIQEFIKSSEGHDIRVNVVGGKVIASMLRYNNNDFRSNITNGGSMKPYEPSDEQKRIALEACDAIGMDFAGVDVMFGEDDEPVICEMNSNPSFKSTLDCTGVNLADYIMDHIVNKLK